MSKQVLDGAGAKGLLKLPRNHGKRPFKRMAKSIDEWSSLACSTFGKAFETTSENSVLVKEFAILFGGYLPKALQQFLISFPRGVWPEIAPLRKSRFGCFLRFSAQFLAGLRSTDRPCQGFTFGGCSGPRRLRKTFEGISPQLFPPSPEPFPSLRQPSPILSPPTSTNLLCF
jgi:hypothetical protein